MMKPMQRCEGTFVAMHGSLLLHHERFGIFAPGCIKKTNLVVGRQGDTHLAPILRISLAQPS
jgi:hypothetical protein